jgi:hypothetical protein
VRRRFRQVRQYLTRSRGGRKKVERDQQGRGTVLFWVAVAGLAFTVLQFAPTGIGWTGAAGEAVIRVFSPDDDGTTVSIVVEPRLVNRQPEYGNVGRHRIPTRATATQVDLYVRNEGDGAVELDKVKIEVTDAAVLESCIPPQGGGPEEAPFELSYFVNIPVQPLPQERTIYRTLHQRVAPHSSGSVNLYLRTLESETIEQLYALKVTLLTGNGVESVDAGRYVVGLPGPISRYGSILPEDQEAIENLYSFDSQLESTWCYRRNMAAIGRLLGQPGMRSPAMKAVDLTQTASNWSAYVDRRPPRAAAEALLEPPGFVDSPSLAVFAAERTGDLRFEHGIEERAVATLLAAAEEHLVVNPRLTIREARAALGFDDSPEGREILAKGEAALRGLGDVSDELAG